MTPLQPGPLSAGMEKQLTAGRSVISHPQWGVAIFEPTDDRWLTGPWSYIGELEDPAKPKDWITAPPGGWGSNPVGDRRIEIETADGTREIGCAADFDWTGEHLSIIAFRLVDEDAQESGSSAIEADTHRATEGAAAADALTERLTKVAYATEFLDVREDILALIERDRKRWLDNIAVCELLAKARADLAARGAPDRPRR